MHAPLPSSEIVLLKDTGHFSMDDNPEGWAAAVVQWCVRWGKPGEPATAK